MDPSYKGNLPALQPVEKSALRDSTVCVVGCGGIGGYVIEMLGRIGVGRIIAVDGDSFEESNLNRQILSQNSNLGRKKAAEAQRRMSGINSFVQVVAVDEWLNKENGSRIIKGSDVVVDALDTIETRLLLEELCESEGIPLVHGAIDGWCGQVASVFPGDRTLSKLYSGSKSQKEDSKMEDNKRENSKKETPSFTPALVAAAQVSEIIKILIQRGPSLRHKLLIMDLFNQEFEVVEMG